MVNRVMEVSLRSHLGWTLLFGLPHRTMAHVFLSWVLILNTVGFLCPVLYWHCGVSQDFIL